MRMRALEELGRTSIQLVRMIVVLLLAFKPVVPFAQTTVVHSTQPPVWGSSVHLVEDVRVGVLDGREEYIFGSVGFVAQGAEGVIVIADDQVPIIRMYDSQGKFIRNVGRKGQGPGEYEMIGGLRSFPDGRIAIWDNRLQRISTYSPQGDFVGSFRVGSSLFASDVFQVDRNGAFYVKTVLHIDQATSKWNNGWIRVSASGKVLDTIAEPSDSKTDDAFVLAGPFGYDRPFVHQLISSMSGNGWLIVGDNSSYTFELRRTGLPTLRIERTYQPIPVSSKERPEWEAWSQFFHDLAKSAPQRGASVAPASAFKIPTVKPAFSEFRTDADGRIWVRRYVEATLHPSAERKPGDKRPRRMWMEQQTYDVFEPSGRFMGTVVLPFNAGFEDATGMTLYLNTNGPDGEEMITRSRIVVGK